MMGVEDEDDLQVLELDLSAVFGQSVPQAAWRDSRHTFSPVRYSIYATASPGEIVATYSATWKVGFFFNLWHSGGFRGQDSKLKLMIMLSGPLSFV